MKVLAVALSAALLIALGGGQAARADTFVGGTQAWVMIGAPTATFIGLPAWETTFHNTLGVTVFGIVIVVLHNGLGQAVYYSTASITLPALGIGPLYEIVEGVPAGSYNATFFAFAPSGVAISAPTSIVILVR
jgi:hypothetical protein